MSDWNWFFSALAQSTAAIVGIFGAFIFTKIINNQREFNNQKRNITEFMHKAELLKENATQRYYCAYFHLLLIRYKGQEVTTQNKLEILDIMKNDPFYINFMGKFALTNIVMMIIKQPTVKSEKIIEAIFPEYKNQKHPMTLHQNYEQALREKELILKVITDIKSHIATIKSFLKEIKNDELSSPLIKWSIALGLSLFFLGVIYPLHFLPLPKGIIPNPIYTFNAIFNTLFSWKGMILELVSLIFLGIMVRFLLINKDMKHIDKDRRKLEYYTRFENYSPYLVGLDENS